MKWKLKPGSFIKKTAAALSMVTMCLSPLAQGAAAATNNKNLISQYLKETGLTTKKQTVGEFWKMVRHVYPADVQKRVDAYVMVNRQEMMPEFEATTFKDSKGVEQVRLTLSSEGQSMNLTFTGDQEKPLKVNSVTVTKKELLNRKGFDTLLKRLASQDKKLASSLETTKSQPVLSNNFILTYKEFSKLSARTKAEYLVQLRYAAEASQKIYVTRYGAQALNDLNSKYDWAAQFLFGQEVYAAASNLTGKPCIVAGYISIYGENGSCGGTTAGKVDLGKQMSSAKATCGGESVSCNPLVYGFNTSGSPYCVGKAQVKYATRTCNGLSPLQGGGNMDEAQNKKRIIESYLKKVKGQDINLVLNEEGKISQEQYSQISSYFADLQGYINKAIQECGQAPLSNIQASREDQVSACDELKKRAFSLQSFALDHGGKCASEKPGSIEQGGSCVCPEGTREGEMNGMPACVYIDGPVPQKEKKKGGWLLPIGIGIAALGLFAWLMKDKDEKPEPPVYIPPAPVNPTPSPTATPIIDPPPACPYPNVLVGGICTPPVVVPLPTDTSEGGTMVDLPGRGGGVR